MMMFKSLSLLEMQIKVLKDVKKKIQRKEMVDCKLLLPDRNIKKKKKLLSEQILLKL